jgi:hypothetical protein
MSFWKRIFGRSQSEPMEPGSKSPIADSARHETAASQHGQQQESSSTIAGVKVLLYLNPPTVRKMEADGVKWQLVVCHLMAQDGPSHHLQEVSGNKWVLSDVAKAWCTTTPIYKDKQGGLCVLFEKVDSTRCQEEGLTYLGTIEPEGYAAFLCRRLGIRVEDVLV